MFVMQLSQGHMITTVGRARNKHLNYNIRFKTNTRQINKQKRCCNNVIAPVKKHERFFSTNVDREKLYYCLKRYVQNSAIDFEYVVKKIQLYEVTNEIFSQHNTFSVIIRTSPGIVCKSDREH